MRCSKKCIAKGVECSAMCNKAERLGFSVLCGKCGLKCWNLELFLTTFLGDHHGALGGMVGLGRWMNYGVIVKIMKYG